MTLNRALMLTTALSLATAFYFAGQAQTPQGAVLLQRETSGEWIELSRDGVTLSEWQPSDGEIYQALDGALHADKDGGY